MSFSLADQDMAHAHAAAAWVGATRRGMSARIEHGRVVLEATGTSEADMLLAWRAALLNERMVANAREGRAAVLGGLLA